MGDDRPQPEPVMTGVTLVRGAHRWTFTCPRGEESQLALRLRELSTGPRAALDPADVAVVALHLAGALKPGLNRIGQPPLTDNHPRTRGAAGAQE